MKYRRTTCVAAAVLTLLLVAAPAFAHVSIETEDAAPEALAKYRMRVPNESDTADTVKIEVQLPNGFGTPSPQPAQGWDVAVEDGVLTLSGGRIAPGDSQVFVFRMQNPAQPGEVTFPVIQTYSDGVEAAWIGAPGSDHPAPVVTIAGRPNPPRERRTQPPSEAPEPAPQPTASPAATQSAAQPSDPAAPGPDGSSPTTAAGVGILIAVLAVGAYALARRRTP